LNAPSSPATQKINESELASRIAKQKEDKMTRYKGKEKSGMGNDEEEKGEETDEEEKEKKVGYDDGRLLIGSATAKIKRLEWGDR